MKKTRLDIQQDILLTLIKPIVYIWMWMDSKRIVKKDPAFNFRRKEPYVMLANHTFLFDVIHVPLRLRPVPFIIASQTLFTKQPSKFLVSQVAHVIPKSKGRSDASAIINIFGAVKRGYPILIFPEGDNTFYGETNYIEESTMKLIKKLKLDVITCNVKGGYLSKPRWATGKRKHRQVVLEYKLEIPKERLIKLSLEEVNNIVVKALYNNDYEYQRQVMVPHPGKKLAEGIENAVYVCPHCEAINTITSSGNMIKCSSCQKEGFIDSFGFIHDFMFDNLIDWDKFQKNFTAKLRDSVIKSTGFMSFLTMENDEQVPIGLIELEYSNQQIHITGAYTDSFPVSLVTNATITLRRDFGFICNEKHYLIKLDHYGASFLRIVQDKY
ncbi:MAG: 1-acyl-sn-glycerol-3-phosphate acyltransferase [Candidatus Izemoplasmatales bacterium]|nr:1-acyl-sn-glycerol-3-phosphate acyltransferase [Candidatus Izemoplasmatales bacterium]